MFDIYQHISTGLGIMSVSSLGNDCSFSVFAQVFFLKNMLLILEVSFWSGRGLALKDHVIRLISNSLKDILAPRLSCSIKAVLPKLTTS